MFATILDWTLMFVYITLFIILWPTVGDLPLPISVIETIVQVAQRAKFIIELPILENIWSWLWLYMRFFFLFYLFKSMLWALKLTSGKDRLPTMNIK